MKRLFYRPNTNEKEDMRKRVVWRWSVSSVLGIIVMTLLSVYLEMWLLLGYGIVLLLIYALSFIFWASYPGYVVVYRINLISIILVTFAVMLLAGGITYSHGLEFVGLACAMASVLLINRFWTIIIFVLYALTIVCTGVMQPYLTVSPYVTPDVNRLYRILNALWISAMTLVFTLEFIKEQSRLERLEAEKLREINAVKSRVYTDITHEFRTPLTIILGMASRMREDLGEWLESGLDLISRNAAIVLRLVNQMLALQKIEAGVMRVEMVNGDIVPLIRYFVNAFRAVADDKEITLSVETEFTTCVIDHDPEKLRIVLYNLLSNALKYTPRGGKVMVSLCRDTSGGANNLSGSRSEQNVVRIAVSDTGVGIPGTELHQIFDRFHKAGREDVEYVEGVGIGLALTREVVNLLGGSITVKSKEGVGSTFSVVLPVTQNASRTDGLHGIEGQAELTEGALPTPGFPQETIRNSEIADRPIALIVDDVPDMVIYLKSCLHDHYQLAIARNGKEGLEKAVSLIPDVIISDVMMPEMDGYEMSERLREDMRTSHIPLIMVTAKADMDSRIRGLETGVDAYITKPFYKDELLVRVRKLIEGRRQLQEHYQEVAMDSEATEPTSPEERFLTRVRDLVAENLSENAFGVDQLCEALFMSRSQLYRKFEALTDTTVARYIRKRRLANAKRLLESQACNVTEAALESGFRNLSHFSTIFKKEFGINPKEISDMG